MTFAYSRTFSRETSYSYGRYRLPTFPGSGATRRGKAGGGGSASVLGGGGRLSGGPSWVGSLVRGRRLPGAGMQAARGSACASD
jgi:hypothetical protein